MLKHRIVFIILLCMLSLSVTSQTLDYPYYMPVNRTSIITVDAMDYDINRSALIFGGTLLNMTHIGDNVFQTGVTSNIEEDVNFFAAGISQNATTHIYSNTDDVFDGNFIVEDETIYSFWINHSFTNHTKDDAEEHIVCLNGKRHIGAPTVSFLVGVDNGTGIDWTVNGNTLIDNVGYETICSQFPQVYNSNVSDFKEYFGFYCNNCDSSNKMRLSYDDTVVFNMSGTFDDLADYTLTTETNYNYALGSADIDSEYLFFLNGVMRFRIPYNITINLYKENSSTIGQTAKYCNEFSNIYMLQYDADADDNSLNDWTTSLNSLFYMFDPLGIEELYGTSTVVDNKVYYNSVYNDCSATITLYELGAYSVYLVGSKAVIQDTDYGFVSPITGEEQFVSKILGDQALSFNTKENLNIDIFTSDWEISKIWVLLNIGKWLLFTAVPIILIILLRSGVLLALIKRV